MDLIFSIILLVAQPMFAAAQLLFVALSEFDFSGGGRLLPEWVATTANILIIFVPLAAAVVTIVKLTTGRIAFWVPLLAMMLTSLMVVSINPEGLGL
jgi:hypothetical protein